ncbi:MAG: cytochrome c-type biogenesis protein CcmH [Gammaproteobacteria bacterium]|nr:cytochrome c-type biogenesis protein CcmH [Gammaproteobacteria bacterium]
MISGFLMVFLTISLHALDPTSFDDAALQQRYELLTEELRCLVCQNETIAGSNAPLAVDLRQQVANQLRAGKTNHEIREYMSARYGEFVHYRPANSGKTKVLWLAPVILLTILLVIFIAVVKKMQSTDSGSEHTA